MRVREGDYSNRDSVVLSADHFLDEATCRSILLILNLVLKDLIY